MDKEGVSTILCLLASMCVHGLCPFPPAHPPPPLRLLSSPPLLPPLVARFGAATRTKQVKRKEEKSERSPTV